MTHSMPRFFIAQERKHDLNGHESHLHYVIEKMDFDPQTNQILEVTTAFTAWGAFNSVLTVSIDADNSFHMRNQDGSFTGSGWLYGPFGNWTIMEFERAVISQTNESFVGTYLFGKNDITAQKLFFDRHSEQKKYFTTQKGYYITPEQFSALRDKPDLIPNAFSDFQNTNT